MKRVDVSVSIWDVEVNETSLHFKYEIVVDGRLNSKGEYNHYHEESDLDSVKEKLQNGLAVEMVLQDFTI